MCRLLDMKKVRTSHCRPQSDGFVELYNRTLKSMLKSFTESEKSDWDEHLPYVMMAYRATIHKVYPKFVDVWSRGKTAS